MTEALAGLIVLLLIGGAGYLYFRMRGARPVPEKLRRGKPLPAETLPGGTDSILFVDDDPALVQLGAEILDSLGYRVTVEQNPQAALQRLRETPQSFDLLITDQTMPGLTGDRLAGEAMRLRPGLPVILCTGYSDLIHEQQALDSGIRAFLQKPITHARLAETVRWVLDTSP